MGFEAVEMVDPARWQAAKDAGLTILNIVAPGMKDGLNRRDNHPTLLCEIRKVIAVARENRIPHVIIFSGSRRGLSDEQGLAHCIEAVGSLARDAEAAGVTLLFEMLNSTDHPDFHADRSAFGFRLVQAVNSPAVRVLYDIYHMRKTGEEILSTLLDHVEWIAHVHVADTPHRGRPRENGEIDYRTIVARGNAAGYTGHWGFEFIPVGDKMQELQASVDLFRSFC
jgi:hydroxypyruvate isomerase